MRSETCQVLLGALVHLIGALGATMRMRELLARELASIRNEVAACCLSQDPDVRWLANVVRAISA